MRKFKLVKPQQDPQQEVSKTTTKAFKVKAHTPTPRTNHTPTPCLVDVVSSGVGCVCKWLVVVGVGWKELVMIILCREISARLAKISRLK